MPRVGGGYVMRLCRSILIGLIQGGLSYRDEGPLQSALQNLILWTVMLNVRYSLTLYRGPTVLTNLNE